MCKNITGCYRDFISGDEVVLVATNLDEDIIQNLKVSHKTSEQGEKVKFKGDPAAKIKSSHAFLVVV